MVISNNGLQQIIKREGVFLHAYQDTVGVWTIGTGHTSAAGLPHVTPGLTITKEQNDEILRSDLKPIEEQAAQYIKVPVTQNQYDAIISIVFNVGPKFWHSSCIQELNAGNVKGAANAIMLWSKPPEIIGRRRTEQKQFLTPDTVQDNTSTSLDDISSEVTEATGIFSTIKDFLSDNFKHVSAGTVATAGAASASQTHYWPYVLGGTVVLAGFIWLGIYVYERKQNGY